MMNILINILLAFVFGLSPGNMTENRLPDEEQSAPVWIVPFGESNHSASYPDSQSHLFAIHQPAESGVELSSKTVSQSDSTTEREDNIFGNRFPESLIRRLISISIHDSRRIRPGLPVRSLIFPFHFFL